MLKREEAEKPVEAGVPLIVRSEVAQADIGALVCDVLLLGISFYNQIFHGLNMWFLILPLLAIGSYLVIFGMIPERYHFTETALEVWHLFYKSASISYEAIFNLEAKGKDGFVNLLQENKVKVYYTAGKAKKLMIVRPRDVYAFAKELKKRCPEFDEDGQESKLEVFFKE